jgi:hypothetical protein
MEVPEIRETRALRSVAPERGSEEAAPTVTPPPPPYTTSLSTAVSSVFEHAALQNVSPIRAPERVLTNRAQFFEDMADTLEAHRDELVSTLTQVDNHYGAEYEVRQVLKTLRGVRDHELHYLERAGHLNSVAVYGSRNIPLYTLIMHGMIPATIAEQVTFRLPEATAPVYKELFDKIQAWMPEYDFSGLQLLDRINYQDFRKEYLLGLNRKGKQPVRPPADVVIFVGSPQTAERVLAENIAKLQSIGDRLQPLRQLFLKFGSGLNPVVVTAQAKKNLTPAIRRPQSTRRSRRSASTTVRTASRPTSTPSARASRMTTSGACWTPSTS